MSMPLYNGIVDPQVRASRTSSASVGSNWKPSDGKPSRPLLSRQDYRSAQGKIASYEAQQKAARVAVEGTTREYNLGLRLVSDLLNNQLEYFRSQVDLLGAQRDLRVAAFQVLAAMGRLTATDLGLHVDEYDVDQHYQKIRDRW